MCVLLLYVDKSAVGEAKQLGRSTYRSSASLLFENNDAVTDLKSNGKAKNYKCVKVRLGLRTWD